MNASCAINKQSLAVFTTFLLLAGCGGGGGSGNASNPGPPDVTEPAVTAMSPGEDSTGIGTTSKLTVTLSESMAAAGINADNFRVTNESSSISGTVRYDSTNKIAVFTPSSPLAPDTRYTATMVTGIKDLADNPLSSDFAWCFVTGSGADDTAPSVTSTVPIEAATDVAGNQKISATFSEEIDTSTLTPSTFTLLGPGNTSILGTVTYLDRTMVFKPNNTLASNTAYTASIENVRDLAGNVLQPAASWTYTTGTNADTLAPLVISTSPAAAVTGVPVSSHIRATFSEPMDPTSLTTANFFVMAPSNIRLIGTVSFDSTNNTATFTRINHERTYVGPHPTPVSYLDANTVYTVTITTGVKDMAGRALANNLVWQFTTLP